MREKGIQKQIESVFDPYRNSLKDVIDSNIDDRVYSRKNPLQLSKPNAPAL